jgi:hypothetical protein
MADIVTGTTTGQLNTAALHQDHADIRREQAIMNGDVRREVANEACRVNDTVKTSGWHNSDRTSTEADRLANLQTQYFISEQNFAHQNSTSLAALKAQVDMQFQATQQAIQLAAEKNATATALASANTNMLVVQEAIKGRDQADRVERENLRYALSRAEARAARCEPVCFIQGSYCGHGGHGGPGNSGNNPGNR